MFKTVFSLMMFLAAVCVAQASDTASLCRELTLESQGSGAYERPIDSCEGIKNCHQRADGTFYYEEPNTRFKVIDAKGGAECPARGSC